MRKYLAITFGLLTILSVVIWIVGALTAAVLPWFGGIQAERIGQIGTMVLTSGDVLIYGFGWLCKFFSQERKNQALGLPGPKRYGHKKDVV